MTIGLKQIEQINCEKVWDNFAQAFSFKGPCEVTTKDYMEFLDKIEEDVPKDKVRDIFATQIDRFQGLMNLSFAKLQCYAINTYIYIYIYIITE